MASKTSTLRGLIQIYRFAIPYLPSIALAILAAALYTSAEMGFLYIMKPFVEAFTTVMKTVKEGGGLGQIAIKDLSFDEMYHCGKLALILGPAVAVLAFLREFLAGRVIWRLLTDVRNAICAAVLPQSLSFFEDRRSGDLMSRITNDVARTQGAFNEVFGNIPETVFIVLFGFATALYFGGELFLYCAVGLPLVLAPTAYLARRIRHYSRQGLQRLSDLTDRMNQIFTGIRIIKAFKMEDVETQDFQQVNSMFLQKMEKVVAVRSLSAGLMEFIIRVFIGAAILTSAWLLQRGRFDLTIGALILCMGGVYYAFNGIKKLIRSYNNLQEATPAVERIMELIRFKPAIEDAHDAQPLLAVARSIAFRNVSFGYGEEKVLQDVSFTVKPGERVALVGKSGAGKSTLVALLMRFYEVQEGAVEYDGVDVRRVTRDSLLDRVAIVAQQTFLFNRTIAENIRYGRRDASQDEVEEAARQANIHDFILTLPDGYDTLCGEFGAKLSGGQRQRIAIARALLKNADILILDEAMVGLDAESEKLVRDALDNLMKGRTTFIITHDLPTIRHADRILFLRDGRLVADGTHEQLLVSCEEYRTLYGLQA